VQVQRSGRRWRIPVGLAALLGFLALPAGASGATAGVAAGTLTFTAASNETNDVSIETAGSVFRVIDNNAPVTAQAGCNQRSVHRVNCATAGVNLVRVLAADNDDSVLTLIGTTDADLAGGRGTDTLQSSDGDDTLTAGKTSVGFSQEQLMAGDGEDTLNGPTGTGGGSSFLDAGPGDDVLNGGNVGFELLFGNTGADVINGGENFDIAFWSGAAAVNVTIGAGANDGEPGEGDDVRGDVEGIQGTQFADVLIGNDQANDISGFGGQDTIEGGGGPDSLDGGDAADTIMGQDGNDSLRGGAKADDLSGGLGTDDMRYDDHGGPVTVTIDNLANDGGGSGGGGAEGDNVRTDIEEVSGTEFNDTLIGSGQDNVLVGREGDDEVSGEGGDDDVFGDFEFQSGTAGADDVGGGAGDDFLFGGGDADVFRGGDGHDFVNYAQFAGTNDLTVTINNVANDGVAGEGDNVMNTVEGVVGANGNDTITGSDAANTLFGGAGTDNLNGGNGPDLLDGETPGLFNPIAGDVFNGGGGNDTVSYRSHGFNPVTVDIGGGANDGAGGGTEGDDVQSTVENLIGTDASDTLTGSGQANTISGGNSTDTLNGGGAADSLTGGAGFGDTLNGEDGNDELNSRGDNFTDTDNCGPGNDTAIVDSFDVRNGCEDVIQ
jgi:Ca2+-binding RTX toxin-like protein